MACYTSFLDCSDLCNVAPSPVLDQVRVIKWGSTCCACYINPIEITCSAANWKDLEWWGVGTGPAVKVFTFVLMYAILHFIFPFTVDFERILTVLLQVYICRKCNIAYYSKMGRRNSGHLGYASVVAGVWFSTRTR